jgi:hypothetical protein
MPDWPSPLVVVKEDPLPEDKQFQVFPLPLTRARERGYWHMQGFKELLLICFDSFTGSFTDC